MEVNVNRSKVSNDFHSFQSLHANCCRRISTNPFFTHSTIDCHITMQLAATNRYIYQPPRAARDKYIRGRISWIRLRIPCSPLFSDIGETPTCGGSLVRAKRPSEKESKMSDAWVMTVVARKYFVSFIILGSVSSGRKMSMYKYEAPGI